MLFNMMFGLAGAGFSWRGTAFASGYFFFFFFEIAGCGRSLANSLKIPGVSQGVSECGR